MSEYECVIIIILSSGSVWPVVHNLMVRTLEANKKVDECTCQQAHKALFCVSNTYCRLWWRLYWIQKSQKVLKVVKSYQGFFYSKEWKTVYTTWPVMLHSATRMYSWRLHTVASKTTSSQTKTRHTHKPLRSCCESLLRLSTVWAQKKIYQGESDALSLFKKNSRSSFFSDVFSQDFHLKHVAWSAILCLFSLSNLQEL